MKPTIVDGYREVDSAVQRASAAHPTLRYSALLRGMPDWVLDGVVNTVEGDTPAATVLVYLATRAGGLIHGNKNPVVVAGKSAASRYETERRENNVLQEVCPRILVDCARELLRRSGLVEFSAGKDPFSANHSPRELRLSPAGEALEGEQRKHLEVVLQA